MRLIVSVALVALGFIVVTGLARRGALPPPDVPVVVYASEPVRVVLPASPNETMIVDGLMASLEERAGATANPIVTGELLALRDNRPRLDWIAETGVEAFDSGRAGALAYALYSADVMADAVTVVSVTAELIPNYRGIATSRDHEDGHALINEELAKQCAPGIAKSLIERGVGGAWLENAIISELHDIGDVAHDLYHSYVGGARLGSHARHARTAVERTVEGSC